MKIAHVIGRFQPFHIGHKAMVDHALAIADKVIILLGDTGCARDSKDPWSVMERTEMIQAVYKQEFNQGRIVISSVLDAPYNNEAWADRVKKTSAAILRKFFDITGDEEYECLLVGHHKDASSEYLSYFPWTFVQSPVTLVGPPYNLGSPQAVDATKIRNALFTFRFNSHFTDLLPQKVYEWMNANQHPKSSHPLFPEEVAKDFAHVERFNRDSTSELTRKYGPPHLHAADALVVHEDSILLIERTGSVGEGQIALPGGFIENHEWPHEAAIRELKEETGLDLSAEYKSVRVRRDLCHVFAAPGRSRRGRTITHVLVHHLRSGETPELKPQEGEVAQAFWFPIKDLPCIRHRFFSDHFHIINELLPV